MQKPLSIVNIGKRGTSADIECVILGKLGMYSGQYIALRTGLSVAQVYARLRTFGINLRDIRNHGSEFNNQVADLARGHAAATITDIKNMIVKLLPPPPQINETQNRQS